MADVLVAILLVLKALKILCIYAANASRIGLSP